MASNYINNLSNTYRSNPSLQNQFATEQDYLDLFDNQKTTSTTATAYTPTKKSSGSIINTKKPIIYQGGDGGEGPSSGRGFNRDDNLGTSDYQGTGPGFFEGVKDTAGGIMDFVSKGGLTGAVLRSIFGKKKDYEYKRSIKTATKARDRIEQERKAAAQAIKDAQIARDFYAGHGRTDTASQPGGADGMSGGQYSGGASFESANTYGGDGTMDNQGADTFAKGGSVRKYFKGGVVSLRNGGAPMYSEEDFPILLDPRRPDGSKPSLYDYDGQYDNYDDEVIEIPMSGKMKKPKKKKKKKTKNYFNGGLVSLRGR